MNKLKAIIWFIIFFTLSLLFLAVAVVFILPITPLLAIFGSGKLKQYCTNCLEGFDNFASSCMGGDPDEAISSRLGKSRTRASDTMLPFIADKVDLVARELFGNNNHCQNSIERDEGRKQVTKY